MRNKITFIFLTLLCSTYLAAQTQIQGKVTEKNGLPLAGVVVSVKDANLAATTSDSNGNYEIKVNNTTDILLFSFIGFEKESIKVGNRQTINVVMRESVQNLSEVVIIGYGAVRKSDITSSISSIKGKELSTMTVGNINNSLQGKVAGLQIIGSSEPASAPKVLIRGFSSIHLSTDPLYVVDGVPVGGNINRLNANEIENIEVLKDASASAIYGSRASNGVIMITTKRGKAGKTTFNLDLSYGVQVMKKPYEMADAVEYAKIVNKGREPFGYGDLFEDPDSFAGKTTNWWDAGIRETTNQMNLGFGVQGGTEKNTYAFSMYYYNQESMYNRGGWDKVTIRYANDYKFSNIVSAGITINPRYESWGNPGNWKDFLRIDPITPIYKPADELTGDENEYSIYARSHLSTIWNPVATASRWNVKEKNYSLSSTAYLQVNPMKDLTLRSQVAFEMDSRSTDKFTPDFSIDPAHEFATYNKVERSHPIYRNWDWQNTITYATTFDKMHNVSVMVGNTMEERHSRSLWGSKQQIPNNSEVLWELDAATLDPWTGGTTATTSMMSYFGRVMYNYDYKYYLTATYRTDGSSKFMKNNKWASFPSASLAWRISKEKFMSGASNVIDDMKIRAGWGKVGNQNLPSAVYLSQLGAGYYSIGGQVVNTSYPNTIKNEDIRWETVEDYNFGLDFSLFGSKLIGAVEYYVKKTKDMLFQKSYPNYSGYPNDARIWTNIGSMESKGFELSLGYNDKFGDFNFGANLTFTTFDVMMKELTNDGEILYGASGRTRIAKGEEPGYFYGYVADGLFQNKKELNSHTNDKGKFLQPNASEGDVRFVDLNKDGVLDDKDRKKIGSPWADFTAGLNLTLEYKNFDVLANFYTSVGNDIVNQNINDIHNLTIMTNKEKGLLNKAWHGEGTSNSIPRLAVHDNNENYVKFSSLYVQDGSYLRLKNLQLGYTFKNCFMLEKVRLYVAGQNLFTITSYDGVDPEVGGDVTGFGFGGWNYPVLRTFLVGANITF